MASLIAPSTSVNSGKSFPELLTPRNFALSPTVEVNISGMAPTA
jgi:hypothetical protein